MPILLASFDEDRVRQNREQASRQTSVTAADASNAAVNANTAANTAAGCNTACSQTETRQPMALAMAYVPWQRWQETYPLEEGLHRGTIFPELDLPFEGKKKGGMRR